MYVITYVYTHMYHCACVCVCAKNDTPRATGCTKSCLYSICTVLYTKVISAFYMQHLPIHMQHTVQTHVLTPYVIRSTLKSFLHSICNTLPIHMQHTVQNHVLTPYAICCTLKSFLHSVCNLIPIHMQHTVQSQCIS